MDAVRQWAICLIAAAAAGTFQMAVLFPVEKFVLLKEKKE